MPAELREVSPSVQQAEFAKPGHHNLGVPAPCPSSAAFDFVTASLPFVRPKQGPVGDDGATGNGVVAVDDHGEVFGHTRYREHAGCHAVVVPVSAAADGASGAVVSDPTDAVIGGVTTTECPPVPVAASPDLRKPRAREDATPADGVPLVCSADLLSSRDKTVADSLLSAWLLCSCRTIHRTRSATSCGQWSPRSGTGSGREPRCHAQLSAAPRRGIGSARAAGISTPRRDRHAADECVVSGVVGYFRVLV